MTFYTGDFFLGGRTFTAVILAEGQGHFSLKILEDFSYPVPYRPLLRQPKFNAGPINTGPNNAGSKKLENKEGLFFQF